MSLLSNFCCCVSIRNGSFATGVYTLILYTTIVTIGAFHVHDSRTPSVLKTLSFVIIIFSALSVASSVLLLIGLCVDCSRMLLPWIMAIVLTGLLDVIYSVFWIIETESFGNELKNAVIIIDMFMCALNFYGILCVASQYQEYRAGRGTHGETKRVDSMKTPVNLTPLESHEKILFPIVSTLNNETPHDDDYFKIIIVYDENSDS